MTSGWIHPHSLSNNLVKRVGKTMKRCTQLFAAGLASTILALPAFAADPEFTKTSEEELKALAENEADEPEWKANAQAGLIMTTGNARTTTLSVGAKASRKAGQNKFQLEAGGAFARSSLFVVDDANGNGTVEQGELTRDSQTTAKSVEGKARYDRFLSEKDSLYLTALALANEPAGKEFVTGGQLGYSRTAFTSDKHTLVLEAGYDFSYEKQTNNQGEFSIHSMRVFAGYESALSEDTGLDASVETLLNVNELENGGVIIADRFEDTRVTAKLAMTTKLFEDISFRFAFEAKYDNVPAGLPALDLPFASGYSPRAQELDTKTEATLIINFL